MRGALLSPDANALLSRPENVTPAGASMLALRKPKWRNAMLNDVAMGYGAWWSS
jgi:hypothetical protein